MAKGDDAVARKRNRARKKKALSAMNKETVSSRVASIIAAKRRRKTGKRRICEGMCFTLPTPEDPFNDRNDPVAKKEKLLNANISRRKKEADSASEAAARASAVPKVSDGTMKSELLLSSQVNGLGASRGEGKGGADVDSDDRVSKYLVLCLKEIQEATSMDWKKKEIDGMNKVAAAKQSPFLTCKWGVDCWRSLSSGSDVVDSSRECASSEQIAWLASVAADTIARREKDGLVVPTPFLVFLVASQERAIEARFLCKPLKALGVHTVSLHSGASLEHQIRGLKSCEPEFIVSTPKRLLALVSMGALNISGVSLLVLDGLGSLTAAGHSEDVRSIRERILGDPRTVVFGDEHSSAPLLLKLVKEPVRRLS